MTDNQITYKRITVPVADVSPDPRNARLRADEGKIKSLAETIHDNGLLEPPVVRKARPEDKVKTPLVLVAGSRRLAAVKLLKWAEMPVSMEPDGVTAARSDASGLIDNLQRESLSPFEQATAFRTYSVNHNAKPAEVAKFTGLSDSHVRACIRMVSSLSPGILRQWEAGHPVATHDRLIKLAAIADRSGNPDHAAQDEAWKAQSTGQVPTTDGGDAGGKGDKGDKGGKRGTGTRAVKKNLDAVVAYLKTDAASGLGAKRDFTVELVGFLTGKRAKPPESMVLPEKSNKKAEKAAKAATKAAEAAQKAADKALEAAKKAAEKASEAGKKAKK